MSKKRNVQFVLITNVKGSLPVYTAFKEREKVLDTIFSRELDKEELETYRTTPEIFKAQTPMYEGEVVSEPT